LSLPQTFQKEEILPLTNAVAGLLPRRDLKRIFRHRTRLSRSAETAAIRSTMSGSESFPRGQQILDGVSGFRVGGRRRSALLLPLPSKVAWFENVFRSITALLT
jgi:hypothetical protein